MLKKKNLGQLSKNYGPFNQKFVTKLSKYGFGIRDPEKKPIPDPKSGSRGQKALDPGSESATLSLTREASTQYKLLLARQLTFSGSNRIVPSTVPSVSSACKRDSLNFWKAFPNYGLRYIAGTVLHGWLHERSRF
jgi:hypothetical protein